MNDWNELCAQTLRRLDETLNAGSADGPDSVLYADYKTLVLEVAESADSESDLTWFSVCALDAIYQGRQRRGYGWIDQLEISTVLVLRLACFRIAGVEDRDADYETAGYALEHLLRFGRHVSLDQPAMVLYAMALRKSAINWNRNAQGTHHTLSHLDRIFQERADANQKWIDVLWEVSVHCLPSTLSGATSLSDIDSALEALPAHPIFVPAPTERCERSFKDTEYVVTTAEGASLTREQRETLRIAIGKLGNNCAIALLADRTCLAVDLAEARYGYDYFVESVRGAVDVLKTRVPEHSMTYLGGGDYLLCIADVLLQVVKDGEYAAPPEDLPEGMGIPLRDALNHRDKALMACVEPIWGIPRRHARGEYESRFVESHGLPVLAMAIPDRALPEGDSPDSGGIGLMALHIGEKSVWDYISEWWHVEVWGYAPLEGDVGLQHSGEGPDCRRYRSDAFMVRDGGGSVSGLPTDQRVLARILEGDAGVVVEVNNRARKVLVEAFEHLSRLHSDPDAQNESHDYFNHCVNRAMGLEPWQYVHLDPDDQRLFRINPDDEPHRYTFADVLATLCDNQALINELTCLREGAMLECGSLLIKVQDVLEKNRFNKTRLFTYESGASTVRRVLDGAKVNVAATLDNLNKICSTDGAAYLNQDAVEMRNLLMALLEAEESERDALQREREREKRRLQKESLDGAQERARLDAQLRYAAIVSNEASKRGGDGLERTEPGSRWSETEPEREEFYMMQPTSISDAVPYLRCLWGLSASEYYRWSPYDDSDDDERVRVRIVRRLEWEYDHRHEPDHPLWKMGTCAPASMVGYPTAEPGLTTEASDAVLSSLSLLDIPEAVMRGLSRLLVAMYEYSRYRPFVTLNDIYSHDAMLLVLAYFDLLGVVREKASDDRGGRDAA